MKLYSRQVLELCQFDALKNILALQRVVRNYGEGHIDEYGRYWYVDEDVHNVLDIEAPGMLHARRAS